MMVMLRQKGHIPGALIGVERKYRHVKATVKVAGAVMLEMKKIAGTVYHFLVGRTLVLHGTSKMRTPRKQARDLLVRRHNHTFFPREGCGKGS